MIKTLLSEAQEWINIEFPGLHFIQNFVHKFLLDANGKAIVTANVKGSPFVNRIKILFESGAI